MSSRPGDRVPQGSRLRHAVLGAGAVGLCLAADLARAGAAVTLVMRPPSLAVYSGAVTVRGQAGTTVRAAIPAVERLSDPVDVVWITVKGPQLETALDRVADLAVRDALVVPLLNGVNHMTALRTAYDARVVAGAVWVDARRVGVAEALRQSLATEVHLALPDPDHPVATHLVADLRAAGATCRRWPTDADVLWRKLSVFAPLALATTAARGRLGAVRRDTELSALMRQCVGEVRSAAAANGVEIFESQVLRRLAAVPDWYGSSLQRDAERGEPLELRDVSDPVLTAGVPAPATRQFVELIRRRTPAA